MRSRLVFSIGFMIPLTASGLTGSGLTGSGSRCAAFHRRRLPSGLAGQPGQASYAAAKEAIRGLSRVAATEWGPDNINVNVVCPLVMTQALAQWKEEYPEVYAKTIQGIPMGRFGDAEKDIGGTCLFLASPAASYISGETITLQGGSGLRP